MFFGIIRFLAWGVEEVYNNLDLATRPSWKKIKHNFITWRHNAFYIIQRTKIILCEVRNRMEYIKYDELVCGFYIV